MAWLPCHIRQPSEPTGQVKKEKEWRRKMREKERQNMTTTKVLEIYDARRLVWGLQSISDYRAWYTPRSCSGTCRSLSDYARGLIDHALRCAQGLFRPLPDHSLRPVFLGYMWNLTRIQFRGQRFFRPCYKVHTSPSSKLGDYISTMHLSMHLSIQFSRQSILSPWHHVPMSPIPRLGD
jgi:hypothetical protein